LITRELASTPRAPPPNGRAIGLPRCASSISVAGAQQLASTAKLARPSVWAQRARASEPGAPSYARSLLAALPL
jgi:hypothetical protein